MSEQAALFKRLAEALPAQAKQWMGEGRQAGVLVALTDEPVPRVLLGRRAMQLKLHPGEIAFPGGKRESSDEGPWNTALREAWEEVGITSEQVRPLGGLPMLLTRFGFEVWPCIGVVPPGLDLVVDPGEFDSVFQPELKAFANHDVYELTLTEDGEHSRWVPHFHLGDDDVWGVTAAVLAQLANLLYDAGFELKRDWGQRP